MTRAELAAFVEPHLKPLGYSIKDVYQVNLGLDGFTIYYYVYGGGYWVDPRDKDDIIRGSLEVPYE